MGPIDGLLCPADAIGNNVSFPGGAYEDSPTRRDWEGNTWTLTNYMFSSADYVPFNGQQPKIGAVTQLSGSYWRSPFRYINEGTKSLSQNIAFAGVSDGLSNTIFMSERGITDAQVKNRTQGGIATEILTGWGGDESSGIGTYFSTPLSTVMSTAAGNRYIVNSSASAALLGGSLSGCMTNRGNAAFDTRPIANRFYTIVPPNGPSAMGSNWNGNNMYLLTANSYHTGGVNAVRGDGAVSFISDTINSLTVAGDDPDVSGNPRSRNGASPFGVWGALGSINGEESIQP
jgi:hypothetical protein